jgi:hypothetical protein
VPFGIPTCLHNGYSKKVLLVESMIIPSKSISYLFAGCHHSGRGVWIRSAFRTFVDLSSVDRDSEGFGDDDVVFSGHALTSRGMASNASSARTTRK